MEKRCITTSDNDVTARFSLPDRSDRGTVEKRVGRHPTRTVGPPQGRPKIGRQVPCGTTGTRARGHSGFVNVGAKVAVLVVDMSSGPNFLPYWLISGLSMPGGS